MDLSLKQHGKVTQNTHTNYKVGGMTGQIDPGRYFLINISTSGKLQILLQSSKLSKHRVVAVIAGVCASLANLAHTRHWYHLADCKMCEIVKIRDTSWALQTYKP